MIPKRRYPTPKEKAEIIARQNGVCAIKDCTDTGPFIFDHELPLWVHGQLNLFINECEGMCGV